MYCTQYHKITYAQTEPRAAILTRLRCKKWTCESCAKRNATIWRMHLIARLPTVSDAWYLMTLTAHSKVRTNLASFENIRTKIDTLIKRMKRVWGDDIEYVRTFERHPSSEAVHAHFIISGLTDYVALGCSIKLKPMAIGVITRGHRNGVWTTKTWLKKTTQELGMGYIADIRKISDNPAHAAFYITKYLTKAQQDLHIPHMRHVQVTRGIGSPQTDESDLVWQVAYMIQAKDLPAGTNILDLNTGEIINNNYWEMNDYYPDE